MEFVGWFLSFIIIIMRWILIIYLLILILYKMIKKYFKQNIYIFEYHLSLLTHLGQIWFIIKEHMNIMDKQYYPLYVQKYKNQIYPYINGFFVICMIMYFINYLLELFNKIHLDLTIYKYILVFFIFINILLWFYYDIQYKYKNLDTYINNTAPELNKKIYDYLLCGDSPNNPANPIDWKVRNLYKRAVDNGIPQRIGKNMIKSSLFLAACTSCMMFLWSYNGVYETHYPDKLSPTVRGRLWLDPPITAESWAAVAERYPVVKEHPAYKDFHKSKDLKVMDISSIIKDE
jgi:hypothetical protein